LILNGYVGAAEDKRFGVKYTLSEFEAYINEWVQKGYIPQGGLTMMDASHHGNFKAVSHYRVYTVYQTLFRPGKPPTVNLLDFDDPEKQ
jgi:hypothetical protein